MAHCDVASDSESVGDSDSEGCMITEKHVDEMTSEIVNGNLPLRRVTELWLARAASWNQADKESKERIVNREETCPPVPNAGRDAQNMPKARLSDGAPQPFVTEEEVASQRPDSPDTLGFGSPSTMLPASPDGVHVELKRNSGSPPGQREAKVFKAASKLQPASTVSDVCDPPQDSTPAEDPPTFSCEGPPKFSWGEQSSPLVDHGAKGEAEVPSNPEVVITDPETASFPAQSPRGHGTNGGGGMALSPIEATPVAATPTAAARPAGVRGGAVVEETPLAIRLEWP
jgi:hypothetical protein